MNDTPPVAKPGHLRYLDALRGIAALAVMAYHFINWKYDHLTFAKLASLVFNGSDAVSFFFVLSGFVLSYKYIVLNQKLDIGKFYINRFFRLWPAYFITIALNALYVNRHNLNLHGLADLFVYNQKHFWEEAILIRNRLQYYIPGWTLSIELALSLFIPFWVVLAKKDFRLIAWVLLAYLLIGNNMRDLFMFHVHFVLGVALSCLFRFLNSAGFRETNWYKYRLALIALAAGFYSIRHIARLFPFGDSYTSFANYVGLDFFHYSAVASFVCIAGLIISPLGRKILEHRLLLFFGRISYGIYLMHWVIVTAIFDNWDQIRSLFNSVYTALGISFLVYALLTTLLATALHYWVELPFIRFSKRSTGRMKTTLKV